MKPLTIAKVSIGIVGLTVFIALVTSDPRFRLRHAPSSESKKRVVAIVGPRSITLDQVEQAVALPLYQADLQRTKLLQQALQHLIDEELLRAEAARKGLTVPELLAEAPQSEAVSRLANLPAPVKRVRRKGAPENQETESSPHPEEQTRIRQALLVALRRQADIRVTLPEPEPPVLPVRADDAPSTGPPHAPVTIIEFSDFECPYCRLSVPVIKEVQAKYPGRVNVVYRDFPGPTHSHASQAAEAARCAGEQGKFWEYHDLLFERQKPNAGWDFSALAKEIGLEHSGFVACLGAGRYRDTVSKDLREGLRLGISSTPTYFVNGRPLVGLHSVADFQAVIDRLLQEPPRP